MTQRRPPTALFKLLNPIIMFFIRNNIGSVSGSLMIIKHIGRKSGKLYQTPIGYARDGDTIYGFTLSSNTQWYKNIQHNPTVTLSIKGKPITARAERVDDPTEVAYVLDVYKREQPNQYTRFFGIPLDLPSAEGALSSSLRPRYVRFTPVRGE